MQNQFAIVQTSICFSEEFRWSWVKVDGVDAPVAIEEADVAVLQCKGRNISPIGAAEGNHIFKRFVSRLVYKASTEREGLPAIGVVQRKIARPFFCDIERVIGGDVTGVGVVIDLIGSIIEVSLIDGIGNVKPKNCRCRAI